MIRFQRRLLITVFAVFHFWMDGAAYSRAGNPRAVLREAQSKVVKLYGAGGLVGLEAYQTGVLVSAEGHLVTINSSVLDSGTVNIVLADGSRRSGQVVAANPVADLALLKIDPAGQTLAYFDLTSTATPNATTAAQPGQPVWAISNQFNIAAGAEPLSVVQSIVAAVTRLRVKRGVAAAYDRGEAIVLDKVTSNPGAAGGAVIDRRGRLLGMIGRELQAEATGAWVSHATPAAEVARVVDQLLAGVVEAEADADLTTIDLLATWGFALMPDIARRTPPYVDYIRPNSPADRAGLRADDLIVMWDRRVGATCRAVKRLASLGANPTTATLTVQRGDELLDLTLEANNTPEPIEGQP